MRGRNRRGLPSPSSREVREAFEKMEKGGRKVTTQGQQDCDRIAAEIYAKSQE